MKRTHCLREDLPHVVSSAKHKSSLRSPFSTNATGIDDKKLNVQCPFGESGHQRKAEGKKQNIDVS